MFYCKDLYIKYSVIYQSIMHIKKSDHEDARIRYFVDYGQYLSFIPADIAEKAPYESFIYDSATHLIPVNQPEIGLWRDHDFFSGQIFSDQQPGYQC